MENVNTGKPSVLLVVMGYNQEGTIGYAIDGALQQDYDGPLTIVLSDDCSHDGTFRIMQGKAAAYKGPHKVILNRNEKNLGYAGHVYRAMRLADSEWVCKADGDDYSFCDRVSLLVRAACSRPGISIAAAEVAMYTLPEDGTVPDFASTPRKGDGTVHYVDKEPLDEYLPRGCVSLYRREILMEIHRYLSGYTGVGEDNIWSIASRIRGTLAYVDREAICYVVHKNNSTLVDMGATTLGGIHQAAVKWNRLRDKQYETFGVHIKWLEDYLGDKTDLLPEKRLWAEGYLELMKEQREKLGAYCAYHHRNCFANACHWLLHKDVPFSRIFPMWFRCLVRYWRRRKAPSRRPGAMGG